MEGESITIPKQPVLGGVGGNPWIFIQHSSTIRASLPLKSSWDVVCRDSRVKEDVLNTAVLSTLIAASDCDNSPVPFITLEGDLTACGLKARIIFRNNLKGTHTNRDNVVEITLVPDDYKVVIPKQPVLGGVGGNPWIWVLFSGGI